MRQEDIGRKLARGHRPGDIEDASNVRAVAVTGEHGDTYNAVITSYGWAVIFARTVGGDMVEFTGWRGYSPSTSTQMGKIRRAIEDEIGEPPEERPEQPTHTSANPINHRVSRVDGPQIG